MAPTGKSVVVISIIRIADLCLLGRSPSWSFVFRGDQSLRQNSPDDGNRK